MKKKIIAAVLFLAVSMMLLAACGGIGSKENASSDAGNAGTESSSESEDTVGVGKVLSFKTTDLSGAPVKREDFSQNKLTVVNVWGTWCSPCVGELPELQEVAEAFADKGVQVIGVLQDGVNEAGARDEKVITNAQKLLSDAGAKYTVILPDKALMTDIISKMQYFPTTFFIDRDGKVVHSVTGALAFKGWSDEINGVLAKIS